MYCRVNYQLHLNLFVTLARMYSRISVSTYVMAHLYIITSSYLFCCIFYDDWLNIDYWSSILQENYIGRPPSWRVVSLLLHVFHQLDDEIQMFGFWWQILSRSSLQPHIKAELQTVLCCQALVMVLLNLPGSLLVPVTFQ